MDELTGTPTRNPGPGRNGLYDQDGQPIELIDPEVADARIHEVPPDPSSIQGEAPRARLESWIVAVVFALFYGIVGYFTLTEGRIVAFDALHQLNEAYMVWWNSPPKMAAITLQAPPIGSLALLPFALVKPLASSLVALPVLTAVAGGILMALVNSILRRTRMIPWLRFGLVALFGLNPMLVFYAGNGESLMLGLVLAGIGLLALISWGMTGGTRYLVAAGLGIGLAMMVDYGYALWAVGFTVAIMMGASKHAESADRTRSTLLVFLTPVVYTLLLWILINTIILGSPFGWLTTQTGMIQVNTTGVLQAVTASPGGAISDLFAVVLGVAPLGLATIVLLLVAGVLSRDSISIGFFVLVVLAAAVPVIRVLVADQADLMSLSVGLPLALLALAGMAWIAGNDQGWGLGAGIVMLIGLIAAIPLSWDAMQHYRFQDQAQAYTRWIDTRDTQEGTKSVGGYLVGVDPEVSMASYLTDELPQTDSSILVDENYSYGPMILTGRPQLFSDRADDGESNWEATLDDPFGKVDYMLVTVSRAGDQLRKKYPRMVAGGEPGLTPIFRTERYVLVEVAETRPEGGSGRGNAGGTRLAPGPQSTPRPFTPQSPPSADSTPGAAAPAAEPAAPESSAPLTPGTGSSSGSVTGGSSAPQLEGE